MDKNNCNSSDYESVCAELRNENIRLKRKVERLNLDIAYLSRVTDNTTMLRDFNEAQVEKANHAKSNFLANMSHEIRTPMNAIVGMDEMILRESTNPQVIKYAGEIKTAGKTLLSIINDILDLSKIESGKMEIIPVDFDPRAVFSELYSLTKNKAADKGLEYIWDISPDIPRCIHADEIRISQVMLNLINNAVKYTQKGYIKLSVSFNREASLLEVSVEDSGMGIKEEDKEKLFESFTRLQETTNRKVEGTGLGLNITKLLLSLMHGSIQVDSVWEKGSVFSVKIPCMVVDAKPIGDYKVYINDNVQKAPEPKLYAPSCKILIIDDNTVNLKVVSALLKDSGIKVSTATSGSDGISILEKETFDLIFLDQMMPIMSGTETLEIIKERGLAKDTPIICLTADAIKGARENYMRLGFTDYFTKPIIFTELEKLLYKYIPKDLIAEKGIEAVSENEDKPSLLLINENPEKLRALRDVLKASFKVTIVKDEETAQKYLSSYKVDYVMRGEN